ncbi:primosomal protein N' [bacterium]|nr:primosomal protein N' [bacterium]
MPTGPEQPFDYLVPDEMVGEILPGRRVYVPLGRSNRRVMAYCVAIERKEYGSRKLKYVLGALDQQTLLSSHMLKMTQWLAEYYLASWGQVLEAVIPAAVRGNAGTREVTLLSVPSEVAARLASIKLSEKQQKVMVTLAAASKPMTPGDLAEKCGCTQAPISTLRKKKLIQSEVRRVSHAHFDDLDIEREPAKTLSETQQSALKVIFDQVRAPEPKPILLHGVTGSGKTEVYIQAIQHVIDQGKQAIVLVPEISLTPQTKQRFASRFDRIAVLHSHMSDVERHWQWKRIASGIVNVVVGARSAVFAPTPQLGMIVLDEEHDTSFKQDSMPRYHAREVAAKRAEYEKVPLILGTATPSLETFYHAQQGHYELISMPNRIGNRPLPAVRTVDMRYDKTASFRGAISRQLYQSMKRTLEQDGQIILLLNRRGHSTHIQCPKCGEVVACPHCELPLTHHITDGSTVCHYCDYRSTVPTVCPQPTCRYSGIRFSGIGTQKLEQEVRAKFGSYPIIRMDSDTMRKPGSHEAALERFRNREVKILVGTQMIAKGLDFPNVTLVGVINADTALHFPDVRAGERTFQLITQVAGRTGRGDLGGEVLVQTLSPDSPAIEAATRHDYALFAEHELPARRDFQMTPFAHMVRIIARGPKQTAVELFMQEVAAQIAQFAEQRSAEIWLQGPAPAPIEKLRGNYRFHLLLHSEDRHVMRAAVLHCREKIAVPDDVLWVADVDPIDMM